MPKIVRNIRKSLADFRRWLFATLRGFLGLFLRRSKLDHLESFEFIPEIQVLALHREEAVVQNRPVSIDIEQLDAWNLIWAGAAHIHQGVVAAEITGQNNQRFD